MSELKVIDLGNIRESIEKDEPVYYEYYAKSEADKVIAELKNEIEVQKRLRDMALASVPNALKVMKIIQHQKYKRCLAMAWWCSAELGMLVSTWESKIKHYKKWQKRWLELAEKFKEAK
jgi:predicted HTH transcriptional regulator